MLRILSSIPLLTLVSAVCNDPGDDPHAIRIDLDNGNVLFSCDQGYVTIRDASASVELSCGDDGVWGPVNPPSVSPLCISEETSTQIQETTNINEETTTEVVCKDPGLVANSVRQFTHFAHGGEVYYTCNSGYCPEGARTRTVILQCRQGQWNQEAPVCSECELCPEPEIAPEKHIYAVVNPDYTATIQCEDGYVIEAGTDITDGTINCIENRQWAEEIPTCHRPAQVVCGEDHMTVVIDKNMMTSMGWTGGAGSLSLTGENTGFDVTDPDCFAKEDDLGENFMFSLKSPFTNKCRTKFEPIGDDYKFSNKVVWKQDTGAISKTATLLDFDCIYQGIFVTSLTNPIKLAINTRTYYTDQMEPFTVSMAVFHERNYTGLVDNVPILHRGKRYFVELMLHEQDKGTPYLKKCYGSSSYLSEAELAKIGTTSKPSQLRTMVENGCPAPRTLVRLEVAPNHHTRRYSFMFPKINVGIAELQFVYLHCEMELKEVGHRPQCQRANDALGGRRRQRPEGGAGGPPGLGGQGTQRSGRFRVRPDGNKQLGGRQYFYREYGLSAEEWMKKQEEKEAADKAEVERLQAMGTGNGGLDIADYPSMPGRKKRAAIEEMVNDDFSKLHDWPVSFGPIIVPKNESEVDEDLGNQVLEKIVPKELYALSEDGEVEEGIAEIQMIEEEIQEMEIEEQTAATKIIVLVVCIIFGGVLVFVVGTLVGLRTDICSFSDAEPETKKVTKRPKMIVNQVIVTKPATKNLNDMAKKMQMDAAAAASSCATSVTEADE